MLRFIPALAILLATTVPAKADYFVWADQKSGVKLSYPDTWKPLNNQQPDDVFTVGVMSGPDRAQCRIRVNKDERYKIFPSQYNGDIQKISYSQPFWTEYNANYDNVTIHTFREVTGLGKGFGSMELISYANAPDEAPDYRTGVLFVSFYDDRAYIAECSSASQSYSKYHDEFLDFIKSVDFDKTVHELTIGNYRNFLKDWGEIQVALPNAVSVTVY